MQRFVYPSYMLAHFQSFNGMQVIRSEINDR
jgi:hypothetical protein